MAKLKIVSGLTGLKLDDLVQRENARRIRALVQVSAASLMAMVFAVGLAIYANDRRLEAIEQRAVAEQESATARAVSDFLVNIFSSARSIETNPNAVTARSILDRGAQRVTVELEGQPEVKHRLSETIALAYNNLGLFDQAIDILNQTASLTDTAGASALSIKAEALFRKGELEAAMDAIAQATRLLERLPKEDSVQASARVQANTERIKALIHYQRGEHEKGLIAFERAILALETLPETEQLALANILQNRALLLSDMGEFTRAGNDLDKARTLVLANAGEKDILLGQIALARAQVDFLGGDIENALTQINRALEVMDRILEQDNPTLADALSMKGQILHAMGQLDDAEKALMASVDVYNNAYGGRHYLSGIAEVYLGLIAGEQNDLTKALMHFEEAKRHYDAGYGGVHPNHGDLLVNQAIVLAAFGDNELAEENCAQGMSILNETLGESAAFTQQLQKVCDDINTGPE
ncbi:tetratricopeptide repeat protein [Alteromonas sp. H39]|uniref:tetratricopeptide repeat protein n=1 Tax=Alteromonas sp. H39 TaxID=3389876 RepID=UPI0039E10339